MEAKLSPGQEIHNTISSDFFCTVKTAPRRSGLSQDHGTDVPFLQVMLPRKFPLDEMTGVTTYLPVLINSKGLINASKPLFYVNSSITSKSSLLT